VSNNYHRKIFYIARHYCDGANFGSCQRKIKTDLYFIYVKPILEYGVTVWAPHTRCGINKLENIQRQTACFAMSDYSRSSSVTEMMNLLTGPVLKLEIEN